MQMKLFLLILVVVLNTSLAKHHSHKYSCPVQRKCPTHKHKICGSDGKLYNSHCNLRKAACESGLALRAVHPDQCTDETVGGLPKTRRRDDVRLDEDCEPKLYDYMKEQLLLKTNDIAVLFTHLDENSDGSININELWRKSGIFKSGDSPCLITDLLQHEDKNQDDFLDFTEFQNAFTKLFTVTMVTLDQALAVNSIQAHVGDNVEIRCDITGKPSPPIIRWARYSVDLATINVPNVKVFSDGSLYLTNVQVSFTGNYTCQSITNLEVTQVHVLHVVVPPVVEVSPRFQWAAPNSIATIDCEFENIDNDVHVDWLKNDEPLVSNQRTTIMNNGTRIQIGELGRSDTGAYSCRVANKADSAVGRDIASLLVQDEPVEASPRNAKKRLWVFHGNGISIYNEGCNGLLHEIDSRDVVPQNGMPLCGAADKQTKLCEWGDTPIVVESRIYAAQPNLNRIVVFHAQQMNVIQVLVTDPQPRQMWHVRSKNEDRIWVLCHGQPELKNKKAKDVKNAESFGNYEEERDGPNFEFQWNSPSQEQQRRNKKTVQIIRVQQNAHNQNVIHLQPIDGHFDLVYDLFVPKPTVVQGRHFLSNNRYAYVTHWNERALVKVDMEQFKYMKTINLVECQPMNAVFTEFGLIILQCQTPVTHQLNGQLLVDQLTDAIIAYNPHIKAHQTFLSPNQHFLVNIFKNTTNQLSSTTIIVQQVSKDGAQFLYDVRTTLDIVNCEFVWKNGDYDAILASGTPNREDLLYLSLIDGRVELISGIGSPTQGSKRGMAVSSKTRQGAVTSLESVFVVDLAANRVQCETQQRHQNPTAILWV